MCGEDRNNSRSYAAAFFENQIPQFVKPPKVTFFSMFMGTDIRRSGLLEDVNDEQSYEVGQTEDET